MKDRMKTAKFISLVGMLSAISVVFYFIEFPLIPTYPFLQFDFSDVVIVMGGLFISPLAAIISQLIKNIIHLMIKGPATAGIGELANLLTGLFYIIPAILLFRKNKLLALITASICFVGSAILLNNFVFLPLYGIPKEARPDTIMYGLLPFNTLKALIVSVSVFVLYKLLSVKFKGPMKF